MTFTKIDIVPVQEQVEWATDWVLGGYENSLVDGQMSHEEIPTFSELVDEIFSSLRYCNYGLGFEANGSHPEVDKVSDNVLKGMIANQIMNTGIHLEAVR